MRPALARRGFQVVVLLILLVGGVVWARSDKTVTLSVDGGAPRHLHTFAGTVGTALARADVPIGEHDLVAPGPDTSLRDGTQISLRRGRPLALTIDGQPRQVWVTANSVAEALDQLGVRADGAYVSAARSRDIPLSGLDVALRTPHRVAVTADGTTRDVVSTAATVGDLLTEAGIATGPSDVASEPLTSYPADGAAVRVTRVRTSQVVETAPVPAQTVSSEDANLASGTTQVDNPGTPGAVERTFAVTTTDGDETARQQLAERIVTPTQDRVVRVGTKAAAAPASAGSPPASNGGLNWAALAQCESSGNPRAVSGPYQGLFQFDQGTWASVGGSGQPMNASPAEQQYRAQLLYQQRGRAPWPVCGRHL